METTKKLDDRFNGMVPMSGMDSKPPLRTNGGSPKKPFPVEYFKQPGDWIYLPHANQKSANSLRSSASTAGLRVSCRMAIDGGYVVELIEIMFDPKEKEYGTPGPKPTA